MLHEAIRFGIVKYTSARPGLVKCMEQGRNAHKLASRNIFLSTQNFYTQIVETAHATKKVF
jgi:hypothetical protein